MQLCSLWISQTRKFISPISIFVSLKQKVFVQKSIGIRFRIFLCSLPWNQKSLLGYACEIIFTLISVSSTFLLTSVILPFFVGIALYFYACCQYFETIVVQLNFPAEKDPIKIQRIRIRQKEILRQIIRFHIDAKE